MKFLLLPLPSVGAINACIGVGNFLSEANHEVMIAISESQKHFLDGYNWLKVIVHRDGQAFNTYTEDNYTKKCAQLCFAFAMNPIDQLSKIELAHMKSVANLIKEMDSTYTQFIAAHKPDILIVTHYLLIPSVILSDIPWIYLHTFNPLRAYHKIINSPPYYSGLSVYNYIEEYVEFRSKRLEILLNDKNSYNEWLLGKGFDPQSFIEYESLSPYLNIYIYPAEIDYHELGPIPQKWFRLEHAVRPKLVRPLGVDESCLTIEGKKIFFDVRSIPSFEVNTMRKLISFITKSRHKFIIARGIFQQLCTFPATIGGDKFVDQIQILPQIDLVIHYGGNNTFVECFYFAKPQIIMACFGDQHDNGRRLLDLRIGKCLDPYNVTESEFLSTIDNILADDELKSKLMKISNQMINSDTGKRLVDKIVQLNSIPQIVINDIQ